MRPLEIEMIRSEINQIGERYRKKGIPAPDFPGGDMARLLRAKKGNEWMKLEYGKPLARQLFGSFWFEGELCILFADTNMGKSILAVQIGDLLTRENSFVPFINQLDFGAVVMYIDFEQSAKQFESRYVDRQYGSFLFADSFYRAEFNPNADDPMHYLNYNDYIKDEITRVVTDAKATVLIIDNITYVRSGTEQAKDATPLMKTLKALKTKHNLSILVIAHTPKRNPYKPLTVNDLQGSKMLMNFADSVFAIGQSHLKKEFRYLKQIKQRNVQEEYGEDNICLISREKHFNFLRYRFEGYAKESDHLRGASSNERELLKQQIIALSQKNLSARQIAKELGLHHSTVDRVLLRMDRKIAEE